MKLSLLNHASKRVVVVGGGSAGISTAARLSKSSDIDVTLVDGSKKHYYQPIWTLVGGGLYNFSDSERTMRSVIPKNVNHVDSNVRAFFPDQNKIETENGELNYDALVIATGIELAFDQIEGAQDALENDPRCVSNYSPVFVNNTYPAIQSFTGGNAVFTQPPQPFKCAGAPQKIMWIANDIWTEKKINANIEMHTAAPSIFGVAKYANELNKLVKARNVNLNTESNWCGIDHTKSEAYFKQMKDGTILTVPYDFIHVTPPQRPISVLREAGDDLTVGGFVAVNKNTMQHDKYSNIFSLGDCSNIPTSRTAAAIAAQHKIVAENIQKFFKNQSLNNSYNGYTSCPLVTSRNTVMLAEFDYDGKPQETFFFDQGKNRKSMFLLKKHFFTKAYWEYMLNGKWGGPGPFRPITNPLNTA